MKEKKWTLIDTKTQFTSLILLVIGAYAVISVFLGILFDYRTFFFCITMIFIGLIFLVVVLLLVLSKHQVLKEKSVKHEDVEEILNKRYAKGEITKEEYQQMKKEIEK